MPFEEFDYVKTSIKVKMKAYNTSCLFAGSTRKPRTTKK